MTLKLPRGYRDPIGMKYRSGGARKWNGTLHRMLADSGLFSKVEEMSFKNPMGMRISYWSRIEIDGFKIGIDTWDSPEPLQSYWRMGHFKPGGPLADLDLIIKIQHQPGCVFDTIEKEIGIPIRAWTEFPSDRFPMAHFQWQPSGHKYIGSLTGNLARGRRLRWKKWCLENPDFLVVHSARRESEAGSTFGLFLQSMKDSKWGVIIKGWIHHDGKNRREPEFTSCGMPLAMNYIPHYPFPMEPGKHFFLLEGPEDLAKLRTVDPAPFAAESRKLYDEHFSPRGAAQTLVDLVNSIRHK